MDLSTRSRAEEIPVEAAMTTRRGERWKPFYSGSIELRWDEVVSRWTGTWLSCLKLVKQSQNYFHKEKYSNSILPRNLPWCTFTCKQEQPKIKPHIGWVKFVLMTKVNVITYDFVITNNGCSRRLQQQPKLTERDDWPGDSCLFIRVLLGRGKMIV